MADPLDITALVATRNECANIRYCLDSLKPAKRVIVLDSNSSDGTPEIAKELGAEVVFFNHRGGYPKKRQWALDTIPITTQWILLIDADEIVPTKLWEEIQTTLASSKDKSAFLISKGFHFLGRRFRFGGFSHSAVVLFRAGMARFERLTDVEGDTFDMEVHERVIIEGTAGVLKTPLIHEDFKGLEAYISRHNRYSTWEAGVRLSFINSGKYGEDDIKPRIFGNSQERRRFLKRLVVHLPFEPVIWFCYHYLLCLGILEGRPGLIAAQIRSGYIRDVHAKIYESRRKGA